MEYLRRCLGLQEDALRLSRVDQQSSTNDEGGVLLDDEKEFMHRSGSASSADEAWATIAEPITPSTLAETCTAIYEALNSLCNLLIGDKTAALHHVDAVAQNLEAKIDQLSDIANEESKEELLVARARLKATLLESAFETNAIDVSLTIGS